MKYNNLILVGCGGIGGWIATLLAKTANFNTLLLVDGDSVEKRNLDRQLFGSTSIGKNKAEALMAHAFKPTHQWKNVFAVKEFVKPGVPMIQNLVKATIRTPDSSILIVAVDNHAARKELLEVADTLEIPIILAANEYTSAEAYFYHPVWQGTTLDPRTYYPELMSDGTGDPLKPSCTGEAAIAAPQLALANMAAATHTMRLLHYWGTMMCNEIIDDDAAYNNSPFHIKSNETTNTTERINNANANRLQKT